MRKKYHYHELALALDGVCKTIDKLETEMLLLRKGVEAHDKYKIDCPKISPKSLWKYHKYYFKYLEFIDTFLLVFLSVSFRHSFLVNSLARVVEKKLRFPLSKIIVFMV